MSARTPIRGARLTTLKGWRDFIAERPEVPELLPEEAWRTLSDDDRFAYDEARLAHHAKLLVVATPTILPGSRNRPGVCDLR